MMDSKNLKKVMEAVLSGPGMDKEVKVDIRINCKTVLFLCQCIEHGIKEKESGVITNLMPPDTIAEITALSEGFREKAGLAPLGNHLNELLKL